MSDQIISIRYRVRPLQPVAPVPDAPAGPLPHQSNWGLGGPPLQITYRRVDAVTLPKRQLRQHKPKQVTQVAASISEFGFIDAVLVDAKGGVVAGVCRVTLPSSSVFLGVVTMLPS